MTKLQHYGIPTRLLDITSNALVAIFFACQKCIDNETDGEVIAFDVDVNDIHSYTSPIANAISESYLFSKYSSTAFDNLLEEAEMHNYFNRFKQHIGEQRENYIEEIVPRFKKPLFISIIIQGNSKDNIIKELFSFGITQEFIFPDSIDIVCQSITKNIKGLYNEYY